MYTKMITTILILMPLILTDVLTEDLTDNKEKCSVLKFQATSGSYLKTKPDFSSATKSLSFCLWYKRVQTAGVRTILNYYTTSTRSEITITDDASTWVVFMGQYTTDNNPHVPFNKWMHICFTWSRASLVNTFYLNGKVFATGTSPDRDLITTSTLYIGSYGGRYVFGGEMTGLSFYGARLTTEQVMLAYKEGPCSWSNVSIRNFPEVILGWTDILKLTRPATVSDIFIRSENCKCNLLDLTPKMTSQLIQELKEDLTADDGLIQELKNNITEELKQELKEKITEELKLRYYYLYI